MKFSSKKADSSAKGSTGDEGSLSMKKRASLESADSGGDKVNTSVKNTRRNKRRSSTGSVGSSSFASRLDTSLLASVEFRINENEELDVIDVEQEMELNRKKEKVRKKMKKQKNKKDAIDPRLYPSYHDKPENNGDEKEDDDEDELSMPNFGQGSMASTSMRSARSSFHSIRSRTSLQKVSAVQGRKVVQLSVIVSPPDYENGKKRKGIDFSKALKESRKAGVVKGIRPFTDLTTFSSPVRLLEIENEEAILVKGIVDIDSKAKTTMKVASVKQSKAPKPNDTPVRSLRQRTFGGDIRDFDVVKSEQGKRARKDNLRQRLVRSMDDINALKLSRQIQGWIPFLAGYESYLVGQVVEVLSDSVVSDPNISDKTKRSLKAVGKNELNDILGFAFKNDNVSNIITQCVDSGWDFSRHLFQQLCNSRWYDTLGQIPFVGSTRFPTTENYTATRDLLNNFKMKEVEDMAAFDLSSGNGFEATKRNQYGTHIGRYKTNEFRIDNRLPTDESIVHSFILSPLSTMVDNGAVHVLRVMANHWKNTLSQPFGNLTHHRLELLDPFETMRVYMPVVCLVLSSLRGRNVWDIQVLGPFVRKCQTLNPTSTANECLGLVNEMVTQICPKLSAGVAAVDKSLTKWLYAIEESCLMVETEANQIFKLVTGVEIGLQFGYDLITQVSWKVPSDKELEKALMLELKGEYTGEIVTESNIRRALNSATPRDKKSLYHLVKAELEDTKPAKVLLNRMKNLLKREIRRESLNNAIRELSVGEVVYESDLKIGDYYWLDDENERKTVYVFEEEESDDIVAYRFVHADTEEDRVIRFGDLEALQCRRYIPVAESIVRAQRCYMNIELDYCNKFKLNTFTEFSFLRTALNRLVVVSQLFCEELDIARLNLLKKVKTINQAQVGPGDLKPGNTYYIYNGEYDVYAPFVCKKTYAPSDPEWQKLEKLDMKKSLPQSTIVIGNGITGLMTTIHSIESVIISGGEIKLYKELDDTAKEEVFERAQIMRLDPRWVSMLRYHLGTTFEDTFIPTSSELHAHMGSNLPKQGYLETTLKDLECILHAEVTKLWSKNIIEVCMGQNVSYDAGLNSLVKLGEHLEVGDKVFRRVDPMGNPCKELHRWSIAETQNAETLEIGDLSIGKEYDIFLKKEKAVYPFKLIKVDLYTRTCKFESLKKNIDDIAASPNDLPPIYPKGSKRLYKTVTIKCETKGESGDFHCDSLSETLEGQRFMIDIGHNHVVDCTRKPDESPHHFEVTSNEPCGYCCISRLDRRMLSQGIGDLFSSNHTAVHRIIGDSIKMVRQTFIAKDMVRLMKTDNWQEHFEKIIENSDFSSLNDKDPVGTKLVEAVEWLELHASEFRRQTLRVKLSETTDNFFLAIELPREYQKWKAETVDRLLLSVKGVSKNRRKLLEELKEKLRHGIDTIWFEACLEVLRYSGVYELEAKNKIPSKPLINSYTKEGLKCLSVGESFRVASKPARKFDLLLKQRNSKLSLKSTIYARSADGTVQRFNDHIEVFREGCLSRLSDGDGESNSAVLTTSVSHYVNNHSISANEQNKGYVFASIGDEESSSHFMNNNALSGGCINAVQFNRFLRTAMEGLPTAVRIQLYSKEINWTNGKIIDTSTMGCYGEDGLLRPGFSNKQVLRYVWWQIVGGKENIESHFSRDWLTKFSASMVPRGMPLNIKFIESLKDDTNLAIFDLFAEAAKNDYSIDWSESLEETLKARRDEISKQREENGRNKLYWEEFFEGWKTSLTDASHERLQGHFGETAKEAEIFVNKVIDFAKESHLYDRRKGQELWNQPKPVDSVVGDFAEDGRTLPSYMAQLTAICTASVALVLYAERLDNNKNMELIVEICSIVVAAISLILSALIIANSWKYKIRNREARAIYLNHHLLSLKKAAFGAMDTKERGEESDDENPFLQDLEEKKKKFVEDVIYYGLEDPDEFIYDYKRLMERSDQAASFEHFQKLLVTYYISDVYQSNSYVQESLVEVYKVCDEIHALLTLERKKTEVKERDHVTNLFHRARDLGPLLEKSINTGLFNLDLFAALRYFASVLCISTIKDEIPVIPIETEVYGIIKTARKVRDEHFGLILKREVPDLEYLHRVMVESDKGSLVFLSAILVFISSAILAVSRIVVISFNDKTILAAIALWSQLSVAILAFISVRYFASYLYHCLWLWIKIGLKIAARQRFKKYGRKVRGFIFMEFFLALIRLCVILASLAALAWCIAMYFPETTGAEESLVPLFIAAVAFGTSILTPLLSWTAEFFLGYRFPTKLGDIVNGLFRVELESLYDDLTVPGNKFMTSQAQERTTWEYVARQFLHKYRFDAILGPDRAGPILQSLQCGLPEDEYSSNHSYKSSSYNSYNKDSSLKSKGSFSDKYV